ncbi:MAG TPA: pyridoxamine 5'-phosphate oxidase [Geminicoccus sp.]|jgi:pyridoxamine 5'-phosphate oxidase|uniref:pyridoxamine 5'-phosphate oxidase n=1 Tax=Geminicoccus sp. TaxID=2024832 RepID=UPI002E34EEA3|nr:pyridoxamine 5'-phosphate oxidase [Geminicoccus sp.]HEX2527627.1 pyridoxamine 5'-phosphate oxidase [Geminicoccus sp.]
MKQPHEMRVSYERAELVETEAGDDPIALFARWFSDATAAGLAEPNAMTLATADREGRPSARIVLLKRFDAIGFDFFTNLESRKGVEMAANPRAALLFWWDVLHRQVRVEGQVTLVPGDEADAYFASRPLGSRIGAWASRQSEVVAGRAQLDEQEAAAAARLGNDPPRPPYWGGYRVAPEAMEFWQGRRNRLHDRLRFVRTDGIWRRERLSP